MKHDHLSATAAANTNRGSTPQTARLDPSRDAAASATFLTRLARKLLISRLRQVRHGRLRLADADQVMTFGSVTAEAPFDVTIRVRHPSFYADAVFGGTVGAGEGFMLGSWQCDDLTGLVRLMVVNRDTMNAVDSGWAHVSTPLLKFAHWLNRNDRGGSRRNIGAHYDLGNPFFALFLDQTMAYSAGIFADPEADLHAASLAKFDAVCSKLALKPGQHLLEIGTGWGGLAVHAAANYGVHVTTTTISREQYEAACERVQRAGLAGQVTVLLEDYRDLKGKFDALTSIEMVEAVGHQYLDTYFRTCGDLLKNNGLMLLQAITIQDQMYAQARRSVDFIQRFIFPGSCIPSVQTLVNSIARSTDMKLFHMEDIGPHYATTLRRWRERFQARLHDVRDLGYSESFIRMWEYYLCYCEGGFEERQLGDVQMLLSKPGSRRASIATIHAPAT